MLQMPAGLDDPAATLKEHIEQAWRSNASYVDLPSLLVALFQTTMYDCSAACITINMLKKTCITVNMLEAAPALLSEVQRQTPVLRIALAEYMSCRS